MSWVITGNAVNPEAVNWVNRVSANGGSVSNSTVAAVSTFCNAINAESGLRGAITRLNLFCGDNLNACLVPLYLAESFGAATKGNLTDENNGPFVSGDFVSTGANGGLTGGSSKYLNTGLAQDQVGSSSSGHLSVSGTGFSTTSDTIALGSYDFTAVTLDALDLRISGNATYRSGVFSNNGVTAASSWGHLVGTKSSSTVNTLYNEGSSVGTNTGALLTRSTRTYFVFGLNNVGSLAVSTAGRIRMYSIGGSLTASQVTAFSSAVSALNTALGRQ
jgi:hypothetical protein